VTSSKFKSVICALIFCSVMAHAAPLVSIGQKTYISKNAKLWTEPNRFGEATAQLKAGLPVDVLDYDASRSWVLVRTPSGREGWVPLRFTSQDTRRTQPMISHKAEIDSGRSPAGTFEEAVVADAAGEKVETVEEPKSGKPFDFSLGYSNQLSVEKAHGFALGVAFNFEVDADFFWGVGVGYKRHAKSSTGVCFTTDQCKVSRASQRFYPHVQAQFRKEKFVVGVNVGLAMDHTSLKTLNLTSGQVEQTDGSGNRITGSGNEFRLGLGLRVGYSFPVVPGMAIGPYFDYDLDVAFSDGSGDFAGVPSGKVFSTIGGGVLFQKVF
jgi:uncharacterized protein YgiM (DUF1202 family)